MHTMGEGGEYKLVLVARTDLKMGKGKVAAQVSTVCKLWNLNMAIPRIPTPLNLVVRQNLWASMP